MQKKVKAVVLDWAGTTIDFGCRAPLQVFVELFNQKGIPITVEEASIPMGMLKIDHIRELLALERVRKEYHKKHQSYPDEATVQDFYNKFESSLLKILPKYCEPIPDVIETIVKLRNSGIKIGSTTGYIKKMMDIVVPIAEKKGYKPDFLITSSEVKEGRPQPWMMYQNAMHFGISPMDHIVKIGDTLVDIGEGKNAGSWTVGLVEGSSLLGYTLEEFQKADKSEVLIKKKEVEKVYKSQGSDFIANSFKDIPEIIERINEKLNKEMYPGNKIHIPPQPYTLFTPGPLTTSLGVKLPMLTDWGSRDDNYMNLVQEVREELVSIAVGSIQDHKKRNEKYTTVIMQGSGTFGVEACLGTAVPQNGKILVISNGQYGKRMYHICKVMNINSIQLEFDEIEVPCLKKIEQVLKEDQSITHVGFIHSETTTGVLNPINDITGLIKKYNKTLIVDSMSAFGGIPCDMEEMGIHYLISSSNKNLQGVPGFCYVICNRQELEKCKNNKARSYSLDLYEQYDYLDRTLGGFRFTSPVHTIRSFREALKELDKEGGVEARFKRYTQLQQRLSEGMKKLNFLPLDLKGHQGPIITTFHSPKCKNYNFKIFYDNLKERNCVIYPGKIAKIDSFRIGTIGNLFIKDIDNLLESVEESIFWNNKL